MLLNQIRTIGIAIGLSLTATAAYAENVVLKYSSWLPVGHHVNVRVMEPWFAEIAKVTEGRVKVETLPKVVGTPQSQFDVVADGLADISFIVTGYTPGRFPLAAMSELPFLGNKEKALSVVFNRIYNKYMAPLGEFKGIKLMTIVDNAAGHVWTLNKPVASVADLKGLKLRSTGPITTEFLNLIGAVPILKSSSEAFEMLTTGAIDGSLGYFETVRNMNMMDLMKHGTIVPGGMYGSTLAIIMNEAAWSKISQQDQAAIQSVSGEQLALSMGTTYDKENNDSLALIKEKKTITLRDASPEFLAELKAIAKPLEEKWIADAKAKGLADPAAVLAEFRAEVAAEEMKSK